MRVRWLFIQLVNLLFLTEWTLCGVVKVIVSGPLVLGEAAAGVWGEEEAGRPVSGRSVLPPRRRLLAAPDVSSSASTPRGPSPSSSPPPTTPPTTQQQQQQQQRQQKEVVHHPVGIPHMWSERQHNQRSHSTHQETAPHHGGSSSSQHADHVASPQGGGGGGGGVVALQEPTGETHTLTYDHVQEGASHSGKPAVTRQDRRKEQLAQLKKQLHRTGGINDILKRPGVDPEITGDANLNLLSVMRLASMNLSELISIDDDVNNNNHTGSVNLTARQLRRKLRRRLASSNKDASHKHGRSRYSLVTTRIRTRAKRSDGDMSDDYTWAVIVGGSGLAILIVVMCACVCARCNVDQKGTEALTPIPADPPTPAVFFVGGNNSADTGVDNTGFAMGDIPYGCRGAEAAGVGGASTSCFGYSALKDDEDCVSLRSATLDLEKS